VVSMCRSFGGTIEEEQHSFSVKGRRTPPFNELANSVGRSQAWTRSVLVQLYLPCFWAITRCKWCVTNPTSTTTSEQSTLHFEFFSPAAGSQFKQNLIGSLSKFSNAHRISLEVFPGKDPTSALLHPCRDPARLPICTNSVANAAIR
jgi:hypothetical protein